mgnify:CR=1 FL=1
MNPLSPQTSGELIPSPVFLATCFLFIPNSLTLNLICETHMNLCILYPPPFLQIYDVLELRSTRCSDIHIIPPIRHPWLSGGLVEHRVQPLLHTYRTSRTSKSQTYLYLQKRRRVNTQIQSAFSQINQYHQRKEIYHD